MKYLNVCNVLFSLLLLLFFCSPFQSEGRQAAEADTLQQYVDEGRKLFIGQDRFTNRGPACISCHGINDSALPISGGTLAANITSFASLPSDALQNRILEIPFPRMAEMKAAYANHSVTKQEANKLIAYLKRVSEQKPAESEPMLAGSSFLWIGLGAGLLFLGIIWVSWHGRKKGSVNEKIYERQIQSV